MEVLLSIIIPVFNGQSYIGELIHSLYSHNKDIEERMEILLINDGSTDHSLILCHKLQNQYRNIQTYNKENSGIAAARQYGLERARGKYVAFCDQDDLCVGSYSEMIRIMGDAELMVCNYKENNKHTTDFITKTECVDGEERELIALYVLGAEILTKDFIQSFPRIRYSIWNCIFLTSMLRDNGISVKRFVDYEDDWILLIESLLSAHKVILSEIPFYSHTINVKSESFSHKYIPEFYVHRQQLIKWVESVENRIQTPIPALVSFHNLLKRRTILWTIYNACTLSYEDFCRDVEQIKEERKHLQDIISIPGSLKENIILQLFAQDKYRQIYLINKYILGLRYH